MSEFEHDIGIDSDGGGSGGDEWLTTYADAITLLLAFFVMILGTATLDQAKYEELRDSIQGAFNAEKFSPQKTEDVEDPPEIVIAEMIKPLIKDDANKIEVTVSNDTLTLEFNSVGMFRQNRAKLEDSMLKILRDVAFEIKKFRQLNEDKNKAKSAYIDIEGHSDNEKIRAGGKYDTNWELSAARASSVVRHLMDTKVVDQAHIRAIGLADTRPKVPYLEATGPDLDQIRETNRRVVMKVRWLTEEEAEKL